MPVQTVVVERGQIEINIDKLVVRVHVSADFRIEVALRPEIERHARYDATFLGGRNFGINIVLVFGKIQLVIGGNVCIHNVLGTNDIPLFVAHRPARDDRGVL